MSDDPDKPFILSRQGILFFLSAPSGAGKTTLSEQLLQRIPNLSPSISYTTRQPRAGEVDGREYHFVSEAEFMRLRQRQAFAEWARVHDFFYGTARAPLEEALVHGSDLLLDIDVQGVQQLKPQFPGATVAIFLLPPSWDELERRLRNRGTDSAEVIARRLARAHTEAQELSMYDYWVVNDQIERAIATVHAIVIAERARVARLHERTLA
ncbi:MAG: guanylate kinase [Deltaproteobacteria bacterium]|nr:guanylate kinase [Deltaproteobacteria bacterium]